MTWSADPSADAGPPGDNRSYDDITQARASTLLRLGLPGPRRAADDLVDQLELPDSSRWLESVLRRPPFDDLPDAGTALLRGPTPQPALIAIKDRAKDIVKKPPTRELYLSALAAYYASIAAALVQHRTFITRQSREELESVLQELASVAPKPWNELFTNAASLVRSV